MAALELYKRSIGSYPDSLDELVPNYITRLPSDPFSSQSFRYSKRGDVYNLYSFGPDLDDDEGRIECERRAMTMDENDGDLIYKKYKKGSYP